MHNNLTNGATSNLVYHEKQVKELCALHSLNNLMQKPNAFTKYEMDCLCQKITPGKVWNPHCSLLGLGNYDINVIMLALQNKGYECVWFDKRKNIDELDLSSILGFILNTPSNMMLGNFSLPLKRRHWVCLRRIGSNFYNLDSKLISPENLGDSEIVFKNYLKEQLTCKDKILLIIPCCPAHSLL